MRTVPMNPIAEAITQMMKNITIILNVIMFVILVYFARGLKWTNEKDRPSIIGFSFMIVTVVMSVMSIII